MKKVKLFSFALAALMLGACTNEDVIDNGGKGTVAPGEKGYISFAFNLPTTPSSRANDDFADGDATEYNVSDATLLLFAGDTEAESKFAGAYSLTLDNKEDINYNITTRYTLVQEIEKPASGDIYAMVILNGKNNNVITTDDNGTTWKLNGQTLTTGESGTMFSSLYTTAQSFSVSDIANANGDGYFLMTNAPMYTKQGGTNDPTGGAVKTLSVIDRDRIYGTQAEAKANPATEIYCERAVAKITVKGDDGNVSGNGNVTAYELKGWALDITSKEAYLVRNVADPNWWGYMAANTADHRFVGSVGLTNTANETFYRTYWAMDPTYALNIPMNDSVNTEYFNTTIGAVPSLTNIGSNAYCLENTFNVRNQNQNQTTRVIVAAKLDVTGADVNDGSFFILNDNKDVIYQKTDVEKTVTTAFMNVPAIRKVLEDNLKAESKVDNDDFVVKFTSDQAGYWDVESITLKDGLNTLFKNDQVPAQLTSGNETYTKAIASVNQDYNIAYYAGGISYYPVRIRHFDDTQTPWTEEGKTDNSYPNYSEPDYLGRYGVLRNNWYEIEVTGIKNIGSPVPDEVYGQDDPFDKWISVRINVLSWAKRSQSVEL